MTLNELLSDGARHAPEFDGGLSNHLPMALLALQRLGADDALLNVWHDRYVVRLESAPAAQAWPAGDPWPGRLGDLSAWPAYRSLFAEWIAHEGAADTLAQALPVLMPGCAAAAFHGPIRVAYATRSRHPGELADALAYWACRFLPLGALPDEPGRDVDPEPLLRRLRAGTSRHGLIFQRLQDAARSAALHQAVAALAIDGRTLERLARLSARAYALSGNFTALHLLTACHAMHVLLAFIDNDGAALRWFWQAWAAGVVAAAMQPLPAPPRRSWDGIVKAALAAADEHVIKLVDSCRELERAYPGGDWRRAASRTVA